MGVDGYVDIVGNDFLEDLSGVASLKQASGLALESNGSLDLDGAFPALEYLGWDGLWIDESATVARLPMLKGVEGNVGVGGEVEEINPIHELDLPALTCVEGEIWIYDNQELGAVRMPDLVSVGTTCDTPFDFGDLVAVAPMTRSAVSPPEDRDPTDRGMASFRGTAEARVRALDQEVRTRAEQRRSERETRRIEAAREAAALRGPAGAPAVPDRSRARASRAEGPQLSYEGGPGLLIEYNDILTTLDLGSLKEVGGPLYLYDMYALLTVDLPELLTVGEWMDIWGLDGLTAFRAPKLYQTGEFYLAVGYDFSEMDLSSFHDNWSFEIGGPYGYEVGPMGAPALTEGALPWDLDLPSLTTVDGWFGVYGVDGLTSISAPVLGTVGGDFEIEYLPGLLTLSVPGLTSVGWLELYDLWALTSLDLGSLTSVRESLSIGYLDQLQTLSFPSLQSVGAGAYYSPYFDVWSNASLESIEAPYLAADLYSLSISYNGALEDFDLAGVFAQYVYIKYNDQLANLPNLSGLGTSEGGATLYIEYNPKLVDLAGLAGVMSPLAQVVIQANPLLTDISGLSAIGTSTGANPAVSGTFNVSGNITLSDCHVNDVMATIAERNGGNLNTAFPSGWTVSNVPCPPPPEQ